MSDSFDFVVKKDDFHETAFLDAPSEAEISLLPEQALLRIDSFSLTANNITYAAVADMIGYWKFFPTEEGWGRIPAWGFAEVVRSGVDGLAEGDRIYGYLPMSKYLVVEPTPPPPAPICRPPTTATAGPARPPTRSPATPRWRSSRRCSQPRSCSTTG